MAAALIPGNAVALLVLWALVIGRTTPVRVLVVRDPDSRPVDDSSDSLGAEESEEIDFLVDLLKNEAKDRDPPPPVTTVRIIKRKPDHHQFAAQHSIRKERVESGPKVGFKEYHVHYHNHQHKEPRKPYVAIDEGGFKPVLWDSQLPLRDFQPYKQLMPYSETARVKSFKDFDSFLKSKLRPSDFRSSSSSSSSEKTDHEIRIQAVKDFETIIKPRFNVYRAKNASPFERLKSFQDFIDSDEDKGLFLNKERFAGFKDFSEIESPPTETEKPPEEKKPPEVAPEKKAVKVRDFAIVIKTKPQPSTPTSKENLNLNLRNYRPKRPEPSPPKIPPFVNKYRVRPVHDRYLSIPKVLEAPGGTPKYIDRLNALKHYQADLLNSPFRQALQASNFDLNNRFYKMGLSSQPSVANLHLSNMPSQLFIRRQG